MLRGLWMRAVLRGIGAPVTDANRRFLYAWWAYEGGGGGPNGSIKHSAKYNWLNTTRPMWRSTQYNSAHVQNYRTWRQGVKATVATLKNGHYPDVLKALRSGDPLKHPPRDGLSIWLSGRRYFGNPAGQRYTARVLDAAKHWNLGGR